MLVPCNKKLRESPSSSCLLCNTRQLRALIHPEWPQTWEGLVAEIVFCVFETHGELLDTITADGRLLHLRLVANGSRTGHWITWRWNVLLSVQQRLLMKCQRSVNHIPHLQPTWMTGVPLVTSLFLKQHYHQCFNTAQCPNRQQNEEGNRNCDSGSSRHPLHVLTLLLVFYVCWQGRVVSCARLAPAGEV